MFSTLTLEDSVNLSAKQIGPNIKERVLGTLRKKYERKVLGKINGYLISIIDVDEDTVKDGSVNDINGDVTYKLEYTAVVFRPIKGSVLSITVDYCNDLGIWGHSSLLPDVSVIECICPKHMIPKGFKHDEKTDEWVQKNPKIIIRPGSEIQLKVFNTQIDATRMLIIGSVEVL